MADFKGRIEKFQQYLQDNDLESFLIEDPIDLFYLTGLELSAGKLIILKNEAYLLVDARYYEASKKTSSIPVRLIKGTPNEHLVEFLKDSSIQILGFDRHKTSYQFYDELHNILKRDAIKTILLPLENPLIRQRLFKDPEEIQFMREAALLGSQGFQYLCQLLKEGVSEEELAIELEIFWKRGGGRKTAFDPIIGFGANSSMPHHRSGKARLEKGQNVLFDIGVQLKNYNSDMTRVVFFGEPHPKIKEVYEIVKEAVLAAFAVCKPGTTLGELDMAARGIIDAKGYGEHFTHSLGHGIGLETHEFPTIRNKPPLKDLCLEPGMALTIEPGIYLPDIGGVRLEDTVVITGDGFESLTGLPLDPVTVRSMVST